MSKEEKRVERLEEAAINDTLDKRALTNDLHNADEALYNEDY